MLPWLYRELVRIRRVEERIAQVYPTDCIKSPVHLSIGQEAVSVGVCAALQPDDVVFGTYRGHALYLARGGDLRAMIAELYGKATGCTGGWGGSMHLIAPEVGMMGASAVVGTTIANAVGYAFAIKGRHEKSPLTPGPSPLSTGARGDRSIVASFFGDGATEEGVFSESLNFAALKQLPILFICENNQYAIHTHQRRRQGNADICARASAFGMPAERIDSGDVLEIIERSHEMAAQVRAGGGPRFLEVMTYRWTEHVGPGEDFQLGYREREEAAPWQAGDPVGRIGAMLEASVRDEIDAAVDAEIDEAFAFAEVSAFPHEAELFAVA